LGATHEAPAIDQFHAREISEKMRVRVHPVRLAELGAGCTD
jgi:hypothetical protein